MIGVAPTDVDWFLQMRDEAPFREANFWTPTPWNIKKLMDGDRFYFLLKAPYRKIAGFGRFSFYENMTAEEAWDRFGRANGVNDLQELVTRTAKYATKRSATFIRGESTTIGCIVLRDPVFLDDSLFVRPEDVGLSFPRQVVKWKSFNVAEVPLAVEGPTQPRRFTLIGPEPRRYKVSRLGERLGQAQFRQQVLAAYGYQCAISGEMCLDVLEAAHIEPYRNEQSNDVRNGIALRADLHKLFDAGLLTVEDKGYIRISSHLDSPYYHKYDRRQVALPADESLHPAATALQFHSEAVFRA